MSDLPTSFKVAEHHRRREACLYIRQSSQKQVVNHTESTRRQYGLRQRAIALGWPDERIRTIDDDQGMSGEYSGNRSGFRDLMDSVAAGDVGIVLSLEVSRLCRNAADWQRLLQIAAFSDTLILDEDGLYDPNDSNDRLLMGFKGALSEYEMQSIRARLLGGQRSKARRGELKMRLPLGLAYNDRDEVVLDPDRAVVEAISLVFATFRRTGSAMQTLKWFRKNAVTLPARPYRLHGEVIWSVPNHSHILFILHNPRYAGCFVYGRTRTRKRPDGKAHYTRLAMEQWQVCIPEAHAGYIGWDEYCRNQETMENNRTGFMPGPGRQPPPRDGLALLQSRVVCGHCGHRMTSHYSPARPDRSQKARWYYYCRHNIVRHGARTCQSLRGPEVDAAVSEFIVAAVNRENIALALAVRDQVRADYAAADRQRANRIEALRAEADMARRRYLAVDPSNRLVAATLEAEWNKRLEALTRAVAEREQLGKAHQTTLSAEQDKRVLEMARDFGTVWNAPTTSNLDRKRLLALLIEDATLTREKYRATIGLRLRGGKTHTLEVELPQLFYLTRRRMPRDEEARIEIKTLVEQGHDNDEVAEELNRRGRKDAQGDPFTARCIQELRSKWKWPSCTHLHRARLREKGYVSEKEIASKMGIDPSTVRQRARRKRGIEACRFKVGRRNFTMYKGLPDSAADHDKDLDCPSHLSLSQQNEGVAK